MGGIFLKMVGKKRQAAQLVEAVAAAPAPPAAQELRPYQAHAVNRVREGRDNWVVVAPTGSGKTLLAVEVTR
jgi:superfamily II DNA or RNA helicase